MLEQRALELLVIKDLLVKIQFVLIFLVMLGFRKNTHNILILSIVLGIDIIILMVQFIKRYRKSITS